MARQRSWTFVLIYSNLISATRSLMASRTKDGHGVFHIWILYGPPYQSPDSWDPCSAGLPEMWTIPLSSQGSQ